MALFHAALFPTRLALARWQTGSYLPLLQADRDAARRAAWHATARRDFQAWLDRGGFSQHDEQLLPAPEFPAVDGDIQLGACS